jgi:hypothetical protein
MRGGNKSDSNGGTVSNDGSSVTSFQLTASLVQVGDRRGSLQAVEAGLTGFLYSIMHLYVIAPSSAPTLFTPLVQSLQLVGTCAEPPAVLVDPKIQLPNGERWM